MKLLIKVGKKQFFTMDMIEPIATATKRSKTDIKRLFKQGAIDILLEKNGHKD